MRTVFRYDSEDIDFKENKVHSFILQVMTCTVLLAKDAVEKNKTADDPLAGFKTIAAEILNMASETGIDISEAR